MEVPSSCQFCGQAVPAGQGRCPSCGNELAPMLTPQAAAPASSQGASGCAVGGGVALLLLVVLLLVSAGAGFYLLRSSAPEPYEVVSPQVMIPPPSPVAPQLVTLTINTAPPGAQVLADGVLLGTTPVVLQRPMSATPIQLTLNAEGHHSLSRELIPNADQTLQVTLAPVEGAPVDGATGPVVEGSSTVRGSLSREVIRSVIRSHITPIRFCYEQQLARRPDLSGRVSVRFVISSSGAVTTSSVESSTLRDPQVESCVARAVQRIRFPPPEGGGVVIVTYPFLFQTAEG